MSADVPAARPGHVSAWRTAEGRRTAHRRAEDRRTGDQPTDRTGHRARRDSTSRVIAGLLLWLGLLVVTYWWAADGGITDLRDWASGLMSVGRIAGLWSAQLLLVQVLLMARMPWLENAYGRDRLVRIHRVVGFTSFSLMVAHIVVIIGGYAAGRWSAVLATSWDLLTNYGGMLLATAGAVCLVMVVVTSLRAARRRLRYESWHLLHLYAYLGVGLALPHQLWTGQEFLQSRAATIYWWTLWALTAGAVLVWRIALPLLRSGRHQLRVTSVVTEASDVVSVYLTGRRLDRLALEAGQFLNVRFLSGAGWTRSNPYSISAAPDGRSIRLTARLVGDGSRRIAAVPPGTRVTFEGPYGRLGERARRRRRVLMIGAGVGVTPLRALAEGLSYAPGDAIIIQRYRDEPLFTDELQVLAAERGLQVGFLPGRRTSPDSVLGPLATGPEDEVLRSWVPDLAERDVFVCGPTPWATRVVALCRAAGLPGDHIHTESFGW